MKIFPTSYRIKFDDLEPDELPGDGHIDLSAVISFSLKLGKLELLAKKYQYMLACLSTLGGAYHLCNHPNQALIFAKQQEFVGFQVGSKIVILKARTYQALNYGLLGQNHRAKKMFRDCKRRARENDLVLEVLGFIEASELWLKRELRSKSLLSYN